MKDKANWKNIFLLRRWEFNTVSSAMNSLYACQTLGCRFLLVLPVGVQGLCLFVFCCSFDLLTKIFQRFKSYFCIYCHICFVVVFLFLLSSSRRSRLLISFYLYSWSFASFSSTWKFCFVFLFSFSFFQLPFSMLSSSSLDKLELQIFAAAPFADSI